MPFVPTPGGGEVHMIFTYGGQVCENVYHVKGLIALTVPQLQQIGEAFRDWWIGSFIGSVPQTLRLERVEVFGLDTETSPGVVISGGTLPATGTNTGAQLPNNVTVAIKWITALRGRSFRGRTYHLGLLEGQVEESNLAGGTAAFLSGSYDNIITDPNLQPFVLSVLSKFHNNAPRTQGIMTPITSVSVDPVVDSQRRRLPGRGA